MMEGKQLVDDEVQLALEQLAAVTKKCPPEFPLGQLNPKAVKAAKGLFFYHTKKIGLLAGVKWGQGFLIVRTNSRSQCPAEWTAPVFYKVKEGSFGLTAGGGSMSSIILLGTDSAVDHFITGKAVIGADFTLALLEGATDGDESNVLNKEAFSVTTSGGLLADFSLAGGHISVNKDRNAAVYGAGTTPQEVLEGSAAREPPPALNALYDALNNVIKNADNDPRKFSGFQKHWSPQPFLKPLKVDGAYPAPNHPDRVPVPEDRTLAAGTVAA